MYDEVYYNKTIIVVALANSGINTLPTCGSGIGKYNNKSVLIEQGVTILTSKNTNS